MESKKTVRLEAQGPKPNSCSFPFQISIHVKTPTMCQGVFLDFENRMVNGHKSRLLGSLLLVQKTNNRMPGTA